MNAIQIKKAALAEDTMIRAIAPAMKKRHAEQAKKGRIARTNAALARLGIPSGSCDPGEAPPLPCLREGLECLQHRPRGQALHLPPLRVAEAQKGG